MTDRIRARVLVTVLLILLTIAGIRAIGPAGVWTRPAGGPVVPASVLLEVILFGLYLMLRRHRPPTAAALASKLNRIVSAALVTSILGVLLGLILYLYSNKPGQPSKRPLGRVLLPKVAPPSTSKAQRLPSHPGLPLFNVLIALLIIAIMAVLIIVWLRGRSRSGLGKLPDIEVDEAADDLARAVESGRLALRDLDDARAAIIGCYVAMEQSLAQAGAERGAAETPDELLGRTLAANLVPQVPASLLTELFYEARYSTHHMPMSRRDQAEHALADIAAELPAGEFA